jgi:hypothetical protein
MGEYGNDITAFVTAWNALGARFTEAKQKHIHILLLENFVAEIP